MRGIVLCAFSPSTRKLIGTSRQPNRNRPRFAITSSVIAFARAWAYALSCGRNTKPDPEVAILEKLVPQPLYLGSQYFVRDLRHNPRAVPCLRIRVHRAAMGEMAERIDPVPQHSVGPFSMDRSDETDAAGIVFEFRRIKG